MEISIKIKKQRLPEFLSYLRSGLSQSGGWRGQGHYEDGGIFVEQLDIPLPSTSGESFQTKWILKWNPDGSLSPINVETENGSPSGWEDSVNNLVKSALEATINQSKERFFRRDTFAYFGPNLDGEYWASGKRFAPAIQNDDVDYLSERIVLLDHWVEAIDHSQSISVGMVQAEKTMTLLSLFANIGFYRIPVEKRWVYVGSEESKRYQLGFHSTSPYPEVMPKRGSECPAGKPLPVDRRDYKSFPVEEHLLHFPSDYRKLFRTFQNLNPTQQEVYFNAAALYWISLVAGRHLPTVRLSYQVAAIDALVEGTDHNKQAFIQLVQKYDPKAPADLIDYLYGNIRSAHFHGGQFPLGEYQPNVIGPASGPEQTSRMILQMNSSRILHPVLIDWLVDHSNA